jgi:hypothetical protein
MRTVAKTSLCGLIFTALYLSSYALPQTAAKKSLARQCAPDLDTVKERIFANPDGKAWNEYASTKQVPHSSGDTGRAIISVKASSTGKHFVRTSEYGEQSARYAASCYDQTGRLRSFHYEMRTGSGWGYEDIRRFNGAGKPVAQSNRYFDTKDNHTIDRPAQAGGLPDFAKPPLYNTFDALPIAGVLKQKPHATAQ